MIKKLFITFLVSFSSFSYAHISDPNIQQALKTIYQQTGGFAWNNSDGWSSSDSITCDAYGISCDNDGNLIGLRLSDNGLMGHESPSISELGDLEFIYLKIESYNGMAPINIHYP